MKAMKQGCWVLLSAIALPMATASAQPGYNFRPMEGADPSAPQVAPGWRPSTPPQASTQRPVDDHMGYRFAPRQPAPANVVPQPSGDPGSFRYKPEEEGASLPPPLPVAIDPNKDPAMQGYGMNQPVQPGQSAFPMPERPAIPEPPPRPSFSMDRPTRPEPPVRPEPPPMPKPLHLEGRYIDGVSRYQQQAYPFRPLEEEKPKEAKTSSGVRPAEPVNNAPRAYPQYQPMPVGPMYPMAPYDQGYNNGPSFNGFRFPFGNGNFPFSFK